MSNIVPNLAAKIGVYWQLLVKKCKKNGWGNDFFIFAVLC
jgi:hypothetical protein